MRYALDTLNQFDRFFEDFAAPKTRRQEFVPAVDAEETESHYLLSMDVPGIKKEDIKIEMKNGILTLSGERKLETTDANRHWTERSWGRFERSFTLGEFVNTDKIEAIYKDGVLRVAVPKAEAAKPKTIEIKGEDKSGFFDKFFSKKPEETAKSLN